MGDVLVLKAADNMGNGVHLTDVLKELVAKALALRRALYKTCDIDETDRCRSRLFGIVHLVKDLKTRVRNVHHADVRLDCTECVVLSLRSCLRDCVKKCTLADIRQTYNTNFQIAQFTYSLSKKSLKAFRFVSIIF